MVLVPLNHAATALHECQLPLGIFGKPIPQAVRLDIRFVDKIDPVLIAQIVPAGVIRIMTCTHRIDVEALHQQDIFDHRFHCDGMSAHRIVLMPVDAAEIDWYAIDQHLPIFDFDHAEPDLTLHHFQRVATAIFEMDQQPIQIGMLPIPLPGIGYLARKLENRLRLWVNLNWRSLTPANGLVILVKQDSFDPTTFDSHSTVIPDMHSYLECGVTV